MLAHGLITAVISLIRCNFLGYVVISLIRRNFLGYGVIPSDFETCREMFLVHAGTREEYLSIYSSVNVTVTRVYVV